MENAVSAGLNAQKRDCDDERETVRDMQGLHVSSRPDLLFWLFMNLRGYSFENTVGEL